METTVLLVDDQPETVAELTRWLTRHGCVVLVANSGLRALAHVRQHLPDVVLVDLMLNDTDAFSVCEELRRVPITSSVPVIIMTSLANEMTLAPDYARRADAFVHKPCHPADLLRTIERVIRLRRPAFHAHFSSSLCPQESS